MIRWCLSAAQLGIVVTKDSDTARTHWKLFVRRGFRWKFRKHNHKFESSRNRVKRGLAMLAEPNEDEFAADFPRDPKKCHVEYVKCMSDRFSQLRFRHTCSRLRFLASLILTIVMHPCWAVFADVLFSIRA